MQIQTLLQEAMNELKAIDFKALERRDELGSSYSFEQAADLIKKIYDDLVQVVENAELLRVPSSTEQRVANLAKNVSNNVTKIRDFVLVGNEANAKPQHETINREVEALYQEDLELLPPLIERADIRKLDPSEVEKKVAHALQAIKDIEEIKEEAQKTKEDIGLVAKEIRDTSGEKGAFISENHFEVQAGEHQDLAKKWFKGSLCSIGVTAILVVALFTGLFGLFPTLVLINAGNDYPRIVQITVFKIILLSIAYLLIHQSLRNYKINQHLYVLNRHRQLTLSVYRFMVNATDKQEESNAIVIQAAKAIFEPGTTGYLDGDDNPNPVNLTEIINKVVEKA